MAKFAVDEMMAHQRWREPANLRISALAPSLGASVPADATLPNFNNKSEFDEFSEILHEFCIDFCEYKADVRDEIDGKRPNFKYQTMQALLADYGEKFDKFGAQNGVDVTLAHQLLPKIARNLTEQIQAVTSPADNVKYAETPAEALQGYLISGAYAQLGGIQFGRQFSEKFSKIFKSATNRVLMQTCEVLLNFSIDYLTLKLARQATETRKKFGFKLSKMRLLSISETEQAKLDAAIARLNDIPQSKFKSNADFRQYYKAQMLAICENNELPVSDIKEDTFFSGLAKALNLLITQKYPPKTMQDFLI